MSDYVKTLIYGAILLLMAAFAMQNIVANSNAATATEELNHGYPVHTATQPQGE